MEKTDALTADRGAAAGDPAAGNSDPVPGVLQLRAGLLAQPQGEVAALRDRSVGPAGSSGCKPWPQVTPPGIEFTPETA